MSREFEPYNHGMPGEDGYGFCEAIRVGNTIRVSEQLSHDMEANFIGEGDFELQVRTTFENIDRLLKH